MTTTRQSTGAIGFAHPGAFWLGVLLVTTGVLLHLPMVWHGRFNGYVLAGMEMDPAMLAGMGAIVAGLAVSLYGLMPPAAQRRRAGALPVDVRALDDTPLRPAHVALLLAMAVAVTIDIMKPTALAFVVPGMTAEYNLRSPLNPTGVTPAAYLALAGITGTVLGSFVWGWLGDLIGRRASILYAGLNFIATSICGAMPSYEWNLAMCFLMGLGVGGMLPIAYALLAETIPSRHRGWLMVLVGADVAGAYILTSWLSAALTPLFGWRVLWLIGLPTGLLFLLMNRWIPESPRFLLAMGRQQEAQAVMQAYGAAVVPPPQAPPVSPAGADGPAPGRFAELIAPRQRGVTLLVLLLAVGSGLVLFGFNLWIPSNLRRLGVADADRLLRNAAMLGFPLAFVAAWLYGGWSSKKTVVLLGALTAGSLFAVAWLGDALAAHRALLTLLLVAPICGISALTAVLSVYSAELYPTRVRARGAGLCAGACKAGGVLIIALVAFGLAPPSITAIALVGAVPLLLAVGVTLVFGVETRRLRLEELQERALARAG